MDETMRLLLCELWHKHGGGSPAPFLRFAEAMEREGDFLEFFREAYGPELAELGGEAA